jgi:hypothetical protein
LAAVLLLIAYLFEVSILLIISMLLLIAAVLFDVFLTDNLPREKKLNNKSG